LGFWKVQGDRFEYLKIEKNGEGHLLTRYGNSILDGSVERKEFPATIKDNTLTIGALGVSGVYKESDKTLVLNGGRFRKRNLKYVKALVAVVAL
jgi:hypothetical protein